MLHNFLGFQTVFMLIVLILYNRTFPRFCAVRFWRKSFCIYGANIFALATPEACFYLIPNFFSLC